MEIIRDDRPHRISRWLAVVGAVLLLVVGVFGGLVSESGISASVGVITFAGLGVAAVWITAARPAPTWRRALWFSAGAVAGIVWAMGRVGAPVWVAWLSLAAGLIFTGEAIAVYARHREGLLSNLAIFVSAAALNGLVFIIPQIGRAILAMVLGIGGSFVYFLGIDWLIDTLLPDVWRARVRPWAFITPAALALLVYLVYPVFNTTYLSLLGPRSEGFVGLDNYIYAFTNETMLISFRNNALWLVFATLGTVGLGLAIAVLSDRVRYERFVKTLIFVPMAISFVGASVVFIYIYAFRPENAPQIGLLNQISHEWLGFDPQAWLINMPWNNFFLIVVFVWIWTGFCVVILSAALKGVPQEVLESARVDGASEWQVFWRIMVPMIASTIAVVSTTMVIYVLKVFDIVYVMTSGNRGTEVIANRMYEEMFLFQNFGRSSAIAVVLLLAIIPMMVVNIRRFQEQEMQR